MIVAWLVAGGALAAAAGDPARDRQWNLDKIGAPEAWSAGDGRGIVIAVVDTGVDLSHEDLAAKIVAGHDFVDGDGDPSDEHGHGTHVAGIAAAITDNGRGVAGVAPGARIMPIRVLDENGEGSAADVVAGVRWAVDHGADVVNLSLGRAAQQVLGTGLDEAVRHAWARGVVVVVSAGNDYVLSSGFADEPALVVSATTREDRKPDYSSGVGEARWGIAAPGGGCELVTCPVEDDVFSTWWAPDQSDVYAYRAGTSMAAPHVAGGAAILLSAGLSPQQAVDRLLETAVDLGPPGRDSTYGAGRIDLAAAVAGLQPGPTPSPSASPSASPAPSPSPSGSPSPSPTTSPSARPAPTPNPSASPTPWPSPTPPGPSPSPTASPSDDPGPEAATLHAPDPPSASPAPPSPAPPPASPAPGAPTAGSEDPTAGAAPVPDVPDSPAGPPSATDPVQGAGDAAPAPDAAGGAPAQGGSGLPVLMLLGGAAPLAAAGAWRRHRRR